MVSGRFRRRVESSALFLNENAVSGVSTLVGYTSQEFDSDRRRAFRSGVANFLNGVGEADVQIIQVTDVIARRA